MSHKRNSHMDRPTYPGLERRGRKLEKQGPYCNRVQDELIILHDALNSSVSSVVITNLDGKISHVNSAFLGIFGYGEKK